MFINVLRTTTMLQLQLRELEALGFATACSVTKMIPLYNYTAKARALVHLVIDELGEKLQRRLSQKLEVQRASGRTLIEGSLKKSRQSAIERARLWMNRRPGLVRAAYLAEATIPQQAKRATSSLRDSQALFSTRKTG
jgi:hypothetical protein